MRGLLDLIEDSETPSRNGVNLSTEAEEDGCRVASTTTPPVPTVAANDIDHDPLPDAKPPPLTPEDREDIRGAVDERAPIQEYDGGQSRADAEQQARAAMRVYRYRLTTSKSWTTLIVPAWTLEDAERDLRGRYEKRFIEVVEHRARRQETRA